MGFLGLFTKRHKGSGLARLPSGCFTMDRSKRILVSTLPRGFPNARAEEIGRIVVEIFRTAAENNMSLRELTIRFGSLKVTARELRGGAIVFLKPLTFGSG